MGVLHFNTPPPLGVIPANIRINFTSPETRGFVLPDAENRTIVCSFIWTKHRNVTDRRTDSYPLAITARPHCEQCGRAVITIRANLLKSCRKFSGFFRAHFINKGIFIYFYTPYCLVSS